MLTILLPVDGSDNSLRAVDHVIALAAAGGQLDVHLLNVQPPITSGVVKSFINQDQLNAFYREEATKALAGARQKLDRAGVAYAHHIGIGHLAETIADYAKQHHAGQIVMGTRGMNAISNLVMGSVATKVIHLSDVPVTLVK